MSSPAVSNIKENQHRFLTSCYFNKNPDSRRMPEETNVVAIPGFSVHSNPNPWDWTLSSWCQLYTADLIHSMGTSRYSSSVLHHKGQETEKIPKTMPFRYTQTVLSCHSTWYSLFIDISFNSFHKTTVSISYLVELSTLFINGFDRCTRTWLVKKQMAIKQEITAFDRYSNVSPQL